MAVRNLLTQLIAKRSRSMESKRYFRYCTYTQAKGESSELEAECQLLLLIKRHDAL